MGNTPGAGPSVGELPAEGEVLDPSVTPTEGEGAPDDEPELPIEGEEGDSGESADGGEGEGSQAAEDGRVIPQYIRGLKETDPKAYKQAKADFFQLRELRSTFPTVQAARDARELIESVGGQEGISEMRTLTSEFKQAAHQFLEGDPQFIKDLAEDDPVAFSLHFPIMLDEMQKRDFGYFADNISKLWDKEFEATGIPRVLQDAKATLEKVPKGPERDAALFYVNEILKWQQSISNRSKKAEDPRVKTLLSERAKTRQSEAQSEQQEFLKGYRTESANTVMKQAMTVFDSHFKNWKLEPQRRERLIGEVVRIANAAVEKDKQFKKDRDALLDAKDSRGATRLVRERYSREWATAVKEVAGTYRLGAGPGKQQQQQPNNQQRPGGQQRPADKGWIRVNTRPAAEEIDRSRTSPEMIVGGKAILRDGRKVDWTHLKRTA
jgi:hypothetical protein